MTETGVPGSPDKGERERDLLGRTRIKEVIELVKNRFPCI